MSEGGGNSKLSVFHGANPNGTWGGRASITDSVSVLKCKQGSSRTASR